MAKKSLFLLLFLNTFIVYAQPDKKFPLEIFISSNYTAVQDDNSQNRFGYGFSIYKAYPINENSGLVTGLEINRIIFYKKVLRIDSESFFTKTTYRLSNLSIPVLVRRHFKNFFIEPGVFFEINLGGNKSGNYIGTFKSEIPSTYSYFLNSESFPVNYGPQLGLGITFPVRNHRLTIKGDYKHGLRKDVWYSDNFKIRYFRLMAGINL